MKTGLQLHYGNTEWLYAPHIVYHQYSDVSRELSLILPYRTEWESDIAPFPAQIEDIHRYACVWASALSEKYSAPNIRLFSADYPSTALPK